MLRLRVRGQFCKPSARCESSGDARPRVVLADDNRSLLDAVSKLVSQDFQVVAAVVDARQAIDATVRLDPDVVVLDITMPEIDGFAAARELRRAAPRTRVLFLTMHESDEYVTAAFGTGAAGYVLKTRIGSDLVGALDHVLDGQLFVPSLTTLSTIASSRGGHAALFYNSDPALIHGAVRLADAALERGDTVVVLAREAIRAGITQHLKERYSVPALIQQGRLVEQDVVEALSQIMPDGRFDPMRLARAVEALDRGRLASPRGRQARLTLIGEVVAALYRNRDYDTAVISERLWNDLTGPLPMLTVCCYPFTNPRHQDEAALFAGVCGEHWAISYAPPAGGALLR
jgi:CheY-like chemotaxis protein